ncbi:MAG: hypothetical protein K6U02_07655 [Firmicutes bacterium]|nr:hypothetical protein [Bacillota bacterium]
MWKRWRVYFLIFVLLVLLGVFYLQQNRTTQLVRVFSAPAQYTPLQVPDPTLRLDLQERKRQIEYTGTHRNIFSASLPPPPAAEPVAQSPPPPPPPAGPPPLTIPFTYFGYVEDPRSGRRRGAFTNGEEVWIAAEGETVMTRFRVVQLGSANAVIEEVSSGRRATLLLEQPPQG